MENTFDKAYYNLVKELKNNEIYILGINNVSKEILTKNFNLKIKGIIDDYTQEKEYFNLKIYKLNEIERGSIVLVTSCLRPLTVLNKIKSLGMFGIDIFSFVYINDIRLDALNKLYLQKEDIEKNYYKYEKIYNILEDEQSKIEFKKIIDFRKSFNLKNMDGFEYKVDKQYFEDFLKFSSEEVIVDAGGFIGDTIISFLKKGFTYKKIYLFEPDPSNIKKAKENLAKYENINFFEMGLSDCKKEIFFSSGGGSASKISSDGDISIKCVSIDEIIKEKVTFIKMDIEGAEVDALLGAKKHIKEDTPKMAICVYHDKDDMWKIPELVLEINQNYKLYLRHYTEGIDETVMYFIPKK